MYQPKSMIEKLIIAYPDNDWNFYALSRNKNVSEEFKLYYSDLP